MAKRFATFLLLIWSIAPVASYSESVRLTGLGPADIFQTDEWSCGAHSVYRVLKYGYGQPTTYQHLRDRIGRTDLPFDISILGLHITGAFLKDSDIGQPPTTLARILREAGLASATEQGDAPIDRIKDLLWVGIPVILLIQVDDLINDDTLRGPQLHYLVANGYDAEYLYVLDSNTHGLDTEQFRITWFDLDLLRYWKGRWVGFYSTDQLPGYGWTAKIAVRTLDLNVIDNAIFGAMIDVYESFGAHRGHIVHFNQPLDSTRLIRQGERFPRLEVSAPWQARVQSDDGGIDCPSSCSFQYRVGTEVTLHVTSLPTGATLRGWSGPCRAIVDACRLTIGDAAQVQPIVECPHCVAVVMPTIANTLLNGIGGPPPTKAVEYFNAGIGHYFLTAQSDEIAGLDAGAYGGAFVRTGKSFNVFEAPAPGRSPVCRFFTTPGTFGMKGSHFYTANPQECEGLKANPNWMYEKIAFHIALPTGGACAAGSLPVYRMFNHGQTGAPNHRFSTDLALYSSFVASGWDAEGVAFCAPASP